MMLNTNFPTGAMSQPTSPFKDQSPPSTFTAQGSQIQRPGSTPAFGEANPSTFQPSTKNPFAPAPGSVQQQSTQPKGPSMNELAFGSVGQQNRGFGQQQPQASEFGQQNTGFPNGANSAWGSVKGKPSGTKGNGIVGGSGMSDIASAFTQSTNSDKNNEFLSQFGSLSGNGNGSTPPSSQFGSMSSQPTGASSDLRAGSYFPRSG